MSVFTGIILYSLIYWVALFAVLPWGNRAPEGDELQAGNATSAPVDPRLKQKFIATAVVAAILWGIVFALIQMDVIDFYQIARTMSQEDVKP
jgi:predicted secreted protein